MQSNNDNTSKPVISQPSVVIEGLRMRPGTDVLEHVRQDQATGTFEIVSEYDISSLRLIHSSPRGLKPISPNAGGFGTFEVWAAGTLSPHSKPIFLGSVLSRTFGEACDALLRTRQHYQPEMLLLRGRGLWTSEEKALKHPVRSDTYPPDSDHTIQPDDIILKATSSACDVN